MDEQKVGRIASSGDRAGQASPGAVASPSPPSGDHPLRKCNCRLCSYDREFAVHLEAVPAEHREFFEELKSRWEHADFDLEWLRCQTGWSPIETAPKDGPVVDLWVVAASGYVGRLANCEWGPLGGSKNRGRYDWLCDGWGLSSPADPHRPTHWMQPSAPPSDRDR